MTQAFYFDLPFECYVICWASSRSQLLIWNMGSSFVVHTTDFESSGVRHKNFRRTLLYLLSFIFGFVFHRTCNGKAKCACWNYIADHEDREKVTRVAVYLPLWEPNGFSPGHLALIRSLAIQALANSVTMCLSKYWLDVAASQTFVKRSDPFPTRLDFFPGQLREETTRGEIRKRDPICCWTMPNI